MGWNHRILAHEDNNDIFLQVHEVYYDNDGKPEGYTEKAVGVSGDSLKSITWTLNKMKECRKKPILWAGDKFPSEYNDKQKKASH